VDWNNTKTDCPQDQCLHRLFEAQVERSPEAIAVVFEEKQLTYRELNIRANQMGHYLRAFGVGPEVLVGICVERSLEMVVAVLGVLKAGGAYVPLDPTYPKERLAFMLEDAGVAVLLTRQKLVSQLPELTDDVGGMTGDGRPVTDDGTPPFSPRSSFPQSAIRHPVVICLDSDREAITQQSETNLISGVRGDNLAYVIYTSGSTGKPKGVAMSHGPLCNLISWQLQNSAFPSGLRTLQFASLSFDVSFQEIFSTWCSGGTLVLISEELRRDAVGLLRFLTQEAVERLFLPFVALQHFAEVADGRESILASVREIVTAGQN